MTATMSPTTARSEPPRLLDRVPPWALLAATMFLIAWGGNQFTLSLVQIVRLAQFL